MLLLASEVRLVISARLVKHIEFNKRGTLIKVLPGINFVLDADNNIGLFNGHHVQLDTDDYVILSSN